MHAASLARSPRLQRVHALLSDGKERSTLEIVKGANVCAVNSCIAELRHERNGCSISCRQVKEPVTGQRIWLYKMAKAAEGS